MSTRPSSTIMLIVVMLLNNFSITLGAELRQLSQVQAQAPAASTVNRARAASYHLLSTVPETGGFAEPLNQGFIRPTSSARAAFSEAPPLMLNYTAQPQSPDPQRSGETPQSTSGSPGVAMQRAEVNFRELAERESLLPPTPAEPQEIEPPMPGPRHRPVPPDALRRSEELTLQAPESGPALAEPSPAPAASFLALEDDGTRIPPDTNGAVGPNHLMVTLNSQVRIQNRDGLAISTVSLNRFWTRASVGTPNAFEPKVLYDPYNNRWIFVAVADDRSAASSILIGVTQTNDPTGTWNLYRVDADAADQVWADFPSIGFNKDWIVVTVNVFSNLTDNFFGSHIYAFNKADLYARGEGRFTLFPFTDGATMVPAITYDNTLSTIFLVEDWNGNSGGKGFLRLSTITGAVGVEKLTTGVAFPSTPNPWDSKPSVENFAPQLGSTQKIGTGDARLGNVVYRNGSLWTAHTAFLAAGGRPTRSAVQWWQLSTTGDVLQRGRIDDPTGNVFYAYPSIAVNKNNDALIGYSQFSATQYASAGYSFRAASDPANTMRASTLLKAGEAPYFKTFSGTRNRWGDYSNTVVDPVNDTDLWTIQEYAAVPSGGTDRWGTWWGKVTPSGAEPSCTFSISPTSKPFEASGGTGSVNVTTESGCNWTANSADFWISITSGSNGTGNGTVNYSVAANTSSNSRTGTLMIAGQTFTVTQSASGSTNTFANPAPITIPSSGPATPYPSSITVSGFAGTVSAVKVTLTNLNHAYPDDIDILLVGPSGQSMILMSDAGGGGDLNNVTLTFDDQAASGLPDDSQVTSGTFKPTNFDASDSFPAPAPAGAPTGSALSVFNGINPNGTWSLYVVDDSDKDNGSIAGGWSLTLIPSTPPAACPTISDLTPTSGPVGAGVTITGTNFTGVTAVKFSNNVPASLTVNSDTQITATVPNGAVTGPVTISKTGCADAQTVTFTVTLPPTTTRVVRARNASAAPGGTAKVAIELDSQGDETGLQLSLSYDPNLLSQPQVEPGNDVKNNFSFFEINDTQAAQGRLGILLLLKDKFAAGSRQVAVVTFTVTSSTSETATQIGFADAPIPRLITDANAGKLTATYLTGTLTFSSGFEADVDGDGLVTVADGQRISLFAAGKPKLSAGSLFQRADCAPRETKGDGLIDLADVVQAMRYAAGKDGSLVPAGGPTGPTTTLAASMGAAVSRVTSGLASARIVRALSTDQANALTVELEAQGDEVGLGFSLQYDPHLLRFAGATLGSGASHGLLTVNDDQAASGRLGLLLALPPGQRFASGRQAMVRIQFIAFAESPTTTRISFGDDPIARQVVDEHARPVAATYSDATITINSRAVASLSAASFSEGELASEAIAAAFGTGLAITTQAAATIPLPTRLAGTTVRVTDGAGVERFAPLFFVSPDQINYLIPEGTLAGPASVTVTSGDGKVSTGMVPIALVAPGLFAANAGRSG